MVSAMCIQIETRNTTNVFRRMMAHREDQVRAILLDATVIEIQAVGKEFAIVMKDDTNRVLQPSCLCYPLFNTGDLFKRINYEVFKD